MGQVFSGFMVILSSLFTFTNGAMVTWLTSLYGQGRLFGRLHFRVNLWGVGHFIERPDLGVGCSSALAVLVFPNRFVLFCFTKSKLLSFTWKVQVGYNFMCKCVDGWVVQSQLLLIQTFTYTLLSALCCSLLGRSTIFSSLLSPPSTHQCMRTHAHTHTPLTF